MSGVSGRSGRLPKPVDEHILRGTHRVDRHGPLPGPRLASAPPMTSPERPVRAVRVPRHLRPATRRWFRDIVRAWALEAHHLRLLQLAAEAWDRCEVARERIAAEGVTVKSARGGPRLHPLLRVEDANRKMFARLIGQLNLEDERTPGGSR